MAEVSFNTHRVDCAEGESVLDALLRQGIDVPFSCKSGLCQTCMMRCTAGKIPAEAQKELKPNLQSQGYFLACQCKPREDITVSLPESEQLYVSAELIDKQSLSPSVVRLRLRTAIPLFYHAGQFVNLKRKDGTIRSYSLASLPSEDNFLELHVKRMPEGVMSNWLADEFNVGDHIDIEGPVGECFYSNDMQGQPVLLVGTGTGLAPLIGVIRDALHQGHVGQMRLYHGAFSSDELYLDSDLKSLAGKYENFSYTPCITGEMKLEDVEKGRACDISLKDNPSLAGWQVFLCGAPSMVKFMQQRAYLAGASLQDIHVDPFETKALSQQARN